MIALVLVVNGVNLGCDSNPTNNKTKSAPSSNNSPSSTYVAPDLEAERKKIRLCMESYRDAVIGNDGEAAAKSVTVETFEAYGHWVALAKHASRQEVKALPLLDRYMVLCIRLRLPKDDVLTMEGRDLFVHAVNESWTSKGTVDGMRISDIQIVGDSATAGFEVDGRKNSNRYDLVLVDGEWKWDMSATFPKMRQGFELLHEKSGASENDWIKSMLFMVSFKTLSDQTWEPLVPQP